MYTIQLDIGTMMLRLLLSALLGGLIGWERERRNKQAGLKTHLLVSVGSTLIMLTSIYGFDNLLLNHPNARFDPARLAAQVVNGIGFLGAGAIMRRSDNIISGLTTAATLWAVAAIGLAIGSGFYLPGIITTVVVLLSNLLLNRLESRFWSAKRAVNLKVALLVQRPATELEPINAVFDEFNMKIRQMRITRESEESEDKDRDEVLLEYDIHASSDKSLHEMVRNLWAVKGVSDVRIHWGG
ncbi:MAG TPA: MgtC/SapB family protein [Paenibacillaceae bacterium]